MKSRYKTVISSSYLRFHGNMQHFCFITAPLRSVIVTTTFPTCEFHRLQSPKNSVTVRNYILPVTLNASILSTLISFHAALRKISSLTGHRLSREKKIAVPENKPKSNVSQICKHTRWCWKFTIAMHMAYNFTDWWFLHHFLQTTSGVALPPTHRSSIFTESHMLPRRPRSTSTLIFRDSAHLWREIRLTSLINARHGGYGGRPTVWRGRTLFQRPGGLRWWYWRRG